MSCKSTLGLPSCVPSPFLASLFCAAVANIPSWNKRSWVVCCWCTIVSVGFSEWNPNPVTDMRRYLNIKPKAPAAKNDLQHHGTWQLMSQLRKECYNYIRYITWDGRWGWTASLRTPSMLQSLLRKCNIYKMLLIMISLELPLLELLLEIDIKNKRRILVIWCFFKYSNKV